MLEYYCYMMWLIFEQSGIFYIGQLYVKAQFNPCLTPAHLGILDYTPRRAGDVRRKVMDSTLENFQLAIFRLLHC